MNIRIPQALMAATAAALVFAGMAQAQERPFEISLDGGLAYNMVSDFMGVEQDNVTQFLLPFQQARLSAYVAPQVAVEGAVLFNYESEGDASASEILLAPGLTYYFAPFSSGETRTYLTGALNWSRVGFDSGTGIDGSVSQFGFGGRIGTKVPVGDAGFVRLEGGYTYLLENEDDGRPAVNRLDLTVGLGAILN